MKVSGFVRSGNIEYDYGVTHDAGIVNYSWSISTSINKSFANYIDIYTAIIFPSDYKPYGQRAWARSLRCLAIE